MKILKAVLALLTIYILAFIIAGCSAISAGTITAKHHTDGYYYTTLQCAGYNSKGLCTTYVPISHYQQPTWRFDITEGKDDGWVYVDEGTWNNYSVGNYYDPRGKR